MPFIYTEADFDPDDKLETVVNFDWFTRNKLAGRIFIFVYFLKNCIESQKFSI